MGRDTKVVIAGTRGCGKTSILEHLIYGNVASRKPPDQTIEDIYCAQIESEQGTQERLRIFDTAGLDDRCKEIPRHLLSFADAYVLVYSVTSEKSFRIMEEMKKDVDKNKERKDAVIVVLGNKADQASYREVDPTVAQIWAASEKVRLWDVSIKDRNTLVEPFAYIVSKLTPPSSKSGFQHLKMTMRTKSDLAH